MGAVMPEVTIVCGPPCAGKTTYVFEHASPGDMVVDHDLIARSLGSPSSHNHGRALREVAEQWVAVYLSEIEAGLHQRAWVVRTLADPATRAALAERLNADVVLLDPGVGVCMARAEARDRPGSTRFAINNWYRRANVKG